VAFVRAALRFVALPSREFLRRVEQMSESSPIEFETQGNLGPIVKFSPRKSLFRDNRFFVKLTSPSFHRFCEILRKPVASVL
jgi:hypothetical protein